MRWLLIASLVVLILWSASPVEAKYVFRDGKWTEMADHEELEPLPAPPPGAIPPEDRLDMATIGIEELPSPDAALRIEVMESIGLKYRDPGVSQAAEEAEAIIASVAGANEAEVQLIRSIIAKFNQGSYKSAAKGANSFWRRYRGSPLRQAAGWLRAEARFARGDYYPAFEDYEAFINTFAGSNLLDKAMVREVQCAEILLGPARRKVLGIGIFSGDDEAMAMLEMVYERRPTGPLAPDALLRIAEYHMDQKDYEKAEVAWRHFLREFPNHSRAPYVELMMAASGIRSYQGPLYDDSSLRRAADTLTKFQDKYPSQAAQANITGTLEGIRRLQALKKYEAAAYYKRAGRAKASAFYCERVIEQYPQTPAAFKARMLLDSLAGIGVAE